MSEKPSEHLTPDLRAFEAALAALAPKAAALDRDRLMYEAGRASLAPLHPPHRGWAWPAAFSAMSALAASLLLALVLRPPTVVERVVRRAATATVVETQQRDEPAIGEGSLVQAGGALTAQPTDARAHQPAPEPSYLDLRDRVLAMGIDTWQPPARLAQTESQPQPTYRELLIELGEIH